LARNELVKQEIGVGLIYLNGLTFKWS